MGEVSENRASTTPTMMQSLNCLISMAAVQILGFDAYRRLQTYLELGGKCLFCTTQLSLQLM